MNCAKKARIDAQGALHHIIGWGIEGRDYLEMACSWDERGIAETLVLVELGTHCTDRIGI